MKRRTFLTHSLAGGIGLSLGAACRSASVARFNREVQAITSGDKQHWFGYYDKWQINASGRYALGNEVDLFFRSPTPGDKLKIGLIDLENGNKWTEIGSSTAWGWQQGCMLQWIPGSDNEVIWNDHGPEGFISRIYNLKTKETRTLPSPVYTLSPDGKFALSLDFERLQFFRPGYGYPALTPRSSWEKAPADNGIFRMDLQTGVSELILSYEQITELERPLGSVADNFHWFNHLLINPTGDRFILLNRSRPFATKSEMKTYLKANPDKWNSRFSSQYITRALTANTDGSGVYPLNDSGQFSHFIWKGNDVITAWAVAEGSEEDAFYEFPDTTKDYRLIGATEMPRNGHNTYVPGTNYEWILNDSYPVGDARLQQLYLFHVPTGRRVDLGEFYEPEAFKGEWRCDLHPRCDPEGKRVFFDSTHEGGRRQMYRIDISDVVG